MGVSAFYIYKKRDLDFAKRSFSIGIGFGAVCCIAVVFSGDANGLAVSKYEPAKMAALEGQWETQKAPAAWYAIAFFSQAKQKNYGTIEIPYALSLIATHSLNGTVKGLKEIIAENKNKIAKGKIAYSALKEIRSGNDTTANRDLFEKYRKYLGFGFLLKRYADDVTKATGADIAKAANESIPQVSVLFWGFRVMLGCWGIMTLLIGFGLWFSIRGTLEKHRKYLILATLAIPVPYIAAESGWIITEMGRQPWTVHEILPTYMSVSSLPVSSVAASLIGFIVFYVSLFAVEIFLMFKYARLGPSSLRTGRYHFETNK